MRLQKDLHSTMFLLIHDGNLSSAEQAALFTFHNVSINSYTGNCYAGGYAHLHSTMFLLIPVT